MPAPSEQRLPVLRLPRRPGSRARTRHCVEAPAVAIDSDAGPARNRDAVAGSSSHVVQQRRERTRVGSCKVCRSQPGANHGALPRLGKRKQTVQRQRLSCTDLSEVHGRDDRFELHGLCRVGRHACHRAGGSRPATRRCGEGRGARIGRCVRGPRTDPCRTDAGAGPFACASRAKAARRDLAPGCERQTLQLPTRVRSRRCCTMCDELPATASLLRAGPASLSIATAGTCTQCRGRAREPVAAAVAATGKRCFLVQACTWTGRPRG